MDIYEAARCRRSVRSFKPDPIPQETLERVLDVARCAPSGMNMQPWKFVLVRDAALKSAIISHCPGQDFGVEAPVLVVACGLPTEGKIAGSLPSTVADVAVAFAHLALAAVSEGLGTCWISTFSEAPIKQVLGVPDAVQIILISPLGYPTDTTIRAKHRKPIGEICSWDKFC